MTLLLHIVCLLLLPLLLRVNAQVIPPPPSIASQSVDTYEINNQNFPYRVEISPLTIPGPNSSFLYALPSSRTWLCKGTQNLLNATMSNPLTTTASNCQLITKPRYLDGLNAQGGEIIAAVPSNIHDAWKDDWRRGYDGIMGLVYIPTTSGNRLVFVRHGESANQRFNGSNFQNSIYQTIPVNTPFTDSSNVLWPDGCFSGYDTVQGVTEYRQCWDSFAGFASIGWMPYNTSSGWQPGMSWVEEGPVIWPQNPYRRSDGKRTGAGFYQPTLYATDDYLYLFTINSQPNRPGAQCMTAARAPLASAGASGSFKNFTATNPFSLQSLPSGFSKDTIRNYYQTPGNQLDCLFPDQRTAYASDASIYFNVARIRGTPYYLGVEEQNPNYQTMRMGLRISTDLMNWSTLTTVDAHNGGWGTGQRHDYPTFVNQEGLTNTDVDPTKFYVVGVQASNQTNTHLPHRWQLSLTCTQPPKPTTLTTTKLSDGKTRFTWETSGTHQWFSIRINEINTNPALTCNQNGDICIEQTVGTSVDIALDPTKQYDWWIHGRNLCAWWGEAASGNRIERSIAPTPPISPTGTSPTPIASPTCLPPPCAAPPTGCSYQGATQCACGTLVCPATGTPATIPGDFVPDGSITISDLRATISQTISRALYNYATVVFNYGKTQ